jgi:hypothetical protein
LFAEAKREHPRKPFVAQRRLFLREFRGEEFSTRRQLLAERERGAVLGRFEPAGSRKQD